jgi:ATP-binding cassette subfamily A (ABC1) protein 2
MDEAEELGDRVAIMSHGTLKTCGSPLFLKNKFSDEAFLIEIAKAHPD